MQALFGLRLKKDATTLSSISTTYLLKCCSILSINNHTKRFPAISIIQLTITIKYLAYILIRCSRIVKPSPRPTAMALSRRLQQRLPFRRRSRKRSPWGQVTKVGLVGVLVKGRERVNPLPLRYLKGPPSHHALRSPEALPHRQVFPLAQLTITSLISPFAILL